MVAFTLTSRVRTERNVMNQSVQRMRCGLLTLLMLMTPAWMTHAANGPSVSPPAHAPGQTATLLPDGGWALVGGVIDGQVSDTIAIANTSSSSQAKIALQFARTGHTTTVLPDGTLFVFGGSDAEGHLVAVAEVIDLSAGDVSALVNDALTPRARHTATLLTDGRVLLAGGVDAHGVAIAAAQLWNPKLNSVEAWNPVLQTPRYDHSASLLESGQDLIAGGRTNTADASLADEVYNPLTNIFEPVTSSDSQAVASLSDKHLVPAIAQSLPLPEAIDVAVDTRIAIRFNQPVNVADLNTANMTLIGPTGLVSGKVVGAEGGMLAFFTPNVDLVPGTTYTAFIQGVKDTTGVSVPLSTIRFTTHRYEAPAATQTLSSTVIAPPVTKLAMPTVVASSSPATKAATTTTKTAPTPQKPDIKEPSPPQAEVEDWSPQDQNRHGQWRVLGLAQDPALASIALASIPLIAPQGQSGVAGHVVRINGKPLAGVAVSIGKAFTTTDADGRFLLANVTAGSQQLLVDGTGVVNNGRHYTKHYIHVNVNSTSTLTLNSPIYLSRVDPATEVAISSPASQEIVLTHPAIPGLEVHIPQGTVLREANGKIVTKVSITPVPIDRAPYPTPSNFSAYFTLQPGGAFVDGDSSHAIKVVYPNYLGLAPGAKVNFYNYDPSGAGWGVYGQGTVTQDGKQVTPDNGTGFRQIMGFGLAIGSTTAAKGTPVGQICNCGDPVDLATGFFMNTETDMSIADVIPISVTRSYMSNDTAVHAFGVGTNFTYAMHLYTPDSNSDVYLVLSDGSQVHYTLQSTSPYIWKNLDSPSAFYGSVMEYVSGGGQINLTQDVITVTLVDKTVLTFASDASQNQLLSMADSNGNTVRVTLSGGRSGNITQVTSPNGRYIQFLYDSCNRVTQATDNLGRSVGYSYVPPTATCTNGLYQVTDQNNHTETYAYDTSNRLQSLTDKNGNRKFYNVYNASNQVVNQTLADGAYWQMSYSLVGGIETTTVTDPRNYVRQDTFNASGYLTQEILAQGQPEQQTTTYTRYGSNLPYQVTDQLGRNTVYNWDAYGKLYSYVRLYGTSGALTYQFSYDPVFHQLASYTDPLGHETQYFYDAFGKLNKVTNALSNSWNIINNGEGLPTSVTDPLGNVSRIGYEQADVSTVTDGMGRQSHIYTDEVGRVVTASDPLGNSYQYAYDLRDQLLNVTDPNGGLTVITYDNNGNVKTVEDPRAIASHQYTPDSRNRVHIYTDPLGKTETYNYDGMSNLTSKLDRKGQTTKYTYDGINRLHIIAYPDSSTLTITWDGGNRPSTFVDTVNGTVSQQYNLLDQLTQESGPQGTINYLYDAAGRRSTVTIAGQANALAYGFDAANRLTSLTQGSVAVGWGYDAANRLTGVTLPNGISSVVTPDAANEILSIAYNKGSTAIANIAYSYDGDGHVSGVSGTMVRPLIDAPLTGTTYDAGNHLTALATGALAYDADGNLQTQAGAGTASYTWNDRNQLTGTSNGTVLSYDALGRLVGRTQGGVTMAFLYDGANQVAVNGNVMLRGANLDEVETQVTSTGTVNYLTDGLGSTSMLTDSTGNVTTLYSYGAYGATATTGLTGVATVDTPFKYGGADYNSIDDLYYLRNRFYSTHLQRFISEDPIGLGGGANTYAYVDGNPISFSDELGLAAHLNLINNSTPSQVELYEWAESYRPEQFNTIVVHGGEDGSFSPNTTGNIRISPEAMAESLKEISGYDPTLPTQLIACTAGAHPESVQKLANALSAIVLASPQTLASNPTLGKPPLAVITLPSTWFGLVPGGTVYQAPTWITFKPH